MGTAETIRSKMAEMDAAISQRQERLQNDRNRLSELVTAWDGSVIEASVIEKQIEALIPRLQSTANAETWAHSIKLSRLEGNRISLIFRRADGSFIGHIDLSSGLARDLSNEIATLMSGVIEIEEDEETPD